MSQSVRRAGLAWPLGLVSVAIAGLLLMHGFESTTLALVDDGHQSGHQSGNQSVHGVLTICVFVASMAGVGLAVASARRPRWHQAAPKRFAGYTLLKARIALSSRLRLIDLCVLRL